MKTFEQQYIELARGILDNGNMVGNDRTGTGMIESFGHFLKFDVSESFPLLTSKKTFFRGAITEMLWYLRGEGNTNYLKEHNISIWDEWERPDGSLGPVYGVQMRKWYGGVLGEFDQIANVIKSLKEDPTSRRHIVNMWAVHELSLMQLPPCPMMFQFNVEKDKLNIHVTQRSADVFLGLPFDVVAFSSMLHIIAHEVGLKPSTVSYSIGSAHIYYNHVKQMETQINRHLTDPKSVPTIEINYQDDLFNENDKPNYEPSDFKIIGYDPHPAIKGEVSK